VIIFASRAEKVGDEDKRVQGSWGLEERSEGSREINVISHGGRRSAPPSFGRSVGTTGKRAPNGKDI